MTRKPPKFVLVTVTAALICLALVGGIAWGVRSTADDEAARDCKRAVAARSDSRAMWLYLIDTATGEDPKKVHTFAVKLDELLPELVCDSGNNWVPKT